jgi:peptidoglycan/LPS O-acetylase OafA/YrhL
MFAFATPRFTKISSALVSCPSEMDNPTIEQHSYATHFHSLDALRGIAALAVLFLHGTELLSPGFVPQSASLAVDLFFILSGFVLAHAYDERLSSGRMSWRDFMAVRLIRLYPMILVGTALGGAVLMLGKFHQTHRIEPLIDLLVFLGSALLVPVGFAMGAANLQAYPLNNPVWSLFFELAVGALYGTRFGRLGKRWIIQVLAVSALCLIVSAILWKGTFAQIGFASPLSFLLGFVRVSYPFWAGVALYRFAALRLLPSPPVLVLCLILGSILTLPFDGKLLSLTIVLFVFPAIVALGARAKVHAHLIRFCSVLGELSYPVYLIHQPVFRIIRNLQTVSPVTVRPWAGLLLGCLISVVGSQLLLTFYDKPVRKWLTLKLLVPNKSRTADTPMVLV